MSEEETVYEAIEAEFEVLREFWFFLKAAIVCGTIGAAMWFGLVPLLAGR